LAALSEYAVQGVGDRRLAVVGAYDDRYAQ
jgi:hypothetical protein